MTPEAWYISASAREKRCAAVMRFIFRGGILLRARRIYALRSLRGMRYT